MNWTSRSKVCVICLSFVLIKRFLKGNLFQLVLEVGAKMPVNNRSLKHLFMNVFLRFTKSVPQDAGRHASHNSKRRDITSYDRARPNHRAVADPYSANQSSACADPYISLNYRWHGLRSAREDCGHTRNIEAVVSANNGHTGAKHTVGANLNPFAYHRLWADVGIGANNYVATQRGACGNVGCLVDMTQAIAPASQPSTQGPEQSVCVFMVFQPLPHHGLESVHLNLGI